MAGVKLSLILLAAAVLAVSAQEQRHGGRQTSYSQNYNYRPRPYYSRPNGYSQSQSYSQSYGYSPSYSRPQEPQNLPLCIASPSQNMYLDPTMPQISPPYPGPYPNQPQISQPYPGSYVDPYKPQISQPYPGPYVDHNQPQISQPYPGPYFDPSQPQISQPYPGPYLDPSQPQISEPYPGPYADPSQPQISEPYPDSDFDPNAPQLAPLFNSDPDMDSPYEPENFIERSRSDFADIKSRAARNIDNVDTAIKRDNDEAKKFVNTDYEDAARLLRSQQNAGLQRAVQPAQYEEQLAECFQRANATLQEQAKIRAERSSQCIQNAVTTADAALNRIRENLKINSDKTYERFSSNEGQLRQCSVRGDSACKKALVRITNQNLSTFAADTYSQVKIAQSTATQHSNALSTCRIGQDRSHYQLRALARDLMDNCISNASDITSPGVTE